MSATYVPRTKIVCTLGPASSDEQAIRGLIEAGMNVARLNFSHGTHAQHRETIALVRRLAAELGRPVALLGDLQGPRIRVGDINGTINVDSGDDLTLVHEGLEQEGEIPITYDHLADDVHVGDRILIDDGLIELLAMEVTAPRVKARVVHGGPINPHKGLNLPGVHVSAPSITEKDISDIHFAIEQDLDYLALSFVRRARDIEELRAMIPRGLLIVAKIEKDVALHNIESIIEASDGVMVARGDLGVELPFEEVPSAQKRIIALANALGRPVITATQMLESMIENPRPTRAEASDVANAILDGTDAVMLSAETAAGAYPRLAVEAMRRIITEVERHPPLSILRRASPRDANIVIPTEVAIAAATTAAVGMLQAPLVVVFTKSGFSARIVAAHRPGVSILVLTDQPRTYRQLALVWGVISELVPHCENYDEMMARAKDAVVAKALAGKGDRIIVTAGVPFDVPGTTNLLKVETV
ncbi:MAG TPA: pyruvate kinase [Gemmatimonadaceae bacterium]|nr:pyruvate kinase [Gemmatimonadaceae bacterium]